MNGKRSAVVPAQRSWAEPKKKMAIFGRNCVCFPRVNGKKRWLFDVHIFEEDMAASENRGTPEWIVYNGIPY